jgi:hypothetical protein
MQGGPIPRGPRTVPLCRSRPGVGGHRLSALLKRTRSDWSAPAHVASGRMPLGRSPKPAAPPKRGALRDAPCSR